MVLVVVHPLLCCVTVLLCYCGIILLCYCVVNGRGAPITWRQPNMGWVGSASRKYYHHLFLHLRTKIRYLVDLYTEWTTLPPPSKLLVHSTPRVWMLVCNNLNSPIEQFPLILHFMINSVKKTQMGVRDLMMAIAVMSSDPLHQINKEMARNVEWKN